MSDFAIFSNLLRDFREQLDQLLVREGKRHMMDAHLDFATIAAIEEHLLPALDAVEAALDWQPSDEDLCPGGEPPMTMQEMHSAAHAQHIALHS
jgi:hypothetical protein